MLQYMGANTHLTTSQAKQLIEVRFKYDILQQFKACSIFDHYSCCCLLPRRMKVLALLI